MPALINRRASTRVRPIAPPRVKKQGTTLTIVVDVTSEVKRLPSVTLFHARPPFPMPASEPAQLELRNVRLMRFDVLFPWNQTEDSTGAAPRALVHN